MVEKMGVARRKDGSEPKTGQLDGYADHVIVRAMSRLHGSGHEVQALSCFLARALW